MATIHKQVLVVMIIVAWTGLARTQQTPAAAVSQPLGILAMPAEVADSENNVRAPVPSIVSIDGAPLLFSSELDRANYLRGGIALGSSYDDNVFNTSGSSLGGYALTAQPHLAFDFSTTRLQLKTQYSAGFTMNQRLTSQNQGSHGLGADFGYRLTPHVTVSVRDNFLITTGFFDQVQNDPGFPGNGILQQSNNYVVTPLSKSTSNIGSAQVSYQFGAGSMAGFSGTSYLTRYRDVPVGASLLDTTGESFSGFYTHRLTPRNWVGVRYGFQRLDFDPVAERSTTQSIQYFHTIYLKRNLEVSFFAGPEYTALDGHSVAAVVKLPYILFISTPTTNDRWTGSGGTSFSWQGERTAAQAQFVRRVSDGGGLQATVNLNGLSGEISRQITPKTTLTGGGSYAAMDPLSAASSVYRVRDFASGRFSVGHRLGSNLGLVFGYARDWQQTASSPAVENINHNRGWISLSYDFVRPLGR